MSTSGRTPMSIGEPGRASTPITSTVNLSSLPPRKPVATAAPPATSLAPEDTFRHMAPKPPSAAWGRFRPAPAPAMAACAGPVWTVIGPPENAGSSSSMKVPSVISGGGVLTWRRLESVEPVQ